MRARSGACAPAARVARARLSPGAPTRARARRANVTRTRPRAATGRRRRCRTGKTDPTNCRAFGEGLHEGVAGVACAFQIVARDAYNNRRVSGGDVFRVHVDALSTFQKEATSFIKKVIAAASRPRHGRARRARRAQAARGAVARARVPSSPAPRPAARAPPCRASAQWSTEAELSDNGNGVYDVSWASNFAGWYSVSVALDRVPIFGSPFKVCVMSSYASAPEGIVHKTVFADEATLPEALPPPMSARDCARAASMMVVRRPIARAEGARPPKHDVLHLFHTGPRHWEAHEMKGPLLPETTALAAVDASLYMFAQPSATERIDGVWHTSLDELRVSGELRRARLPVKGEPPHATSGAQIATMRTAIGEATFWFVGGKDSSGRLADVFCFDSLSCTWTCYHSSVDALGSRTTGEPPSKREHHSVIAFKESLWIFGGRSDLGCLDDLHVLDTGAGVAEWKLPEAAGELPSARELHSAVLIEPTGQMLVIGGLDESNSLHEDVMMLNLYGVTWTKLEQGVIPKHSIACACACGELFTFGGLDKSGHASDVVQVVDITTFHQVACLDTTADPTQYVAVKGQGGTIGTLRNTFTVEAWLLARAWPPYATVLSKADMGWKTGFALAKYGAGKGDVEEVPQVNFWLTPGYATTKVQAMIEPFVWTHVAGTYDGQHLRIVINGTTHDSVEFKAEKEEEIDALHYTKADLCIGAHPNKAAWDGLIDEVRIWNVCRSDAEIRENMNEPLAGLTPGLIGQWTFNEGAGDLCIDSSGNRNHGTIEGGLTRVPSTRTDKPDPNRPLNAAEKRVEDKLTMYKKWKDKLLKVRAPARAPTPPRAAGLAAAGPAEARVHGVAARAPHASHIAAPCMLPAVAGPRA